MKGLLSQPSRQKVQWPMHPAVIASLMLSTFSLFSIIGEVRTAGRWVESARLQTKLESQGQNPSISEAIWAMIDDFDKPDLDSSAAMRTISDILPSPSPKNIASTRLSITLLSAIFTSEPEQTALDPPRRRKGRLSFSILSCLEKGIPD